MNRTRRCIFRPFLRERYQEEKGKKGKKEKKEKAIKEKGKASSLLLYTASSYKVTEHGCDSQPQPEGKKLKN